VAERSVTPRPPAIGSGYAAPAGFADILLDRALITRENLTAAEQHAAREAIPLAEALVELGLVAEADSYAAFARAGGLSLVDLYALEPSELAIRLVPERLARQYEIVPVSVDNRTLIYATFKPFDAYAERDQPLRRE
jgi:type IV pilus assembly protein PilB